MAKGDVGGREPAWLHALMLDWADPLLHFAHDQLGQPSLSQRVTREVFLQLVHAAGDDAPHAGDLFELAQVRIARLPTPRPVAEQPWQAAVMRLPPEDRRWCWLAAYGRWSFDVLAASASQPPDTVSLALERVWWALGSTGARPHSETEWRQWLAEVGPPPPPAGLSFDWSAWSPGARPTKLPSRLRPRHALIAAAAVAVLGAGAFVLHQDALAAVPPLPFAAAPRAAALNLVVEGGPSVAAEPFGSSTLAHLAAKALAPGLASYRISTASAAERSTAYRIGALQVGWVPGPHGLVMVLREAAGAAPVVYNLASHGQRVGGTVAPRGYVLYRFAGQAGAVRVVASGRQAIFAWTAPGGPHRWVHVDSGAWSPAAGQPVPRGAYGSWVYQGPPGSGGRVQGVLSSGLLWVQHDRWWLLPTRGPAIPLVHLLPNPAGTFLTMNPATAYPGAANEVLVSTVGGGASTGADLWWNLTQNRWGTTAAVAAPLPSVLALRAGWISLGPFPQLLTYGSPPSMLTMKRGITTLTAWEHWVFGPILQAGGKTAAVGTYGWRHGTFVPAQVVQTGEVAAVAFPDWGPTYVDNLTAPTPGMFGDEIQGPATVSLTAANGGYRTTVPLSTGETLTVERRWLVVQNPSGHDARVGWPNAAGQLQWHTLAPGTVPQVGSGFLWWAQDGHTYLWMPPFMLLAGP